MTELLYLTHIEKTLTYKTDENLLNENAQAGLHHEFHEPEALFVGPLLHVKILKIEKLDNLIGWRKEIKEMRWGNKHEGHDNNDRSAWRKCSQQPERVNQVSRSRLFVKKQTWRCLAEVYGTPDSRPKLNTWK